MSLQPLSGGRSLEPARKQCSAMLDVKKKKKKIKRDELTRVTLQKQNGLKQRAGRVNVTLSLVVHCLPCKKGVREVIGDKALRMSPLTFLFSLVSCRSGAD